MGNSWEIVCREPLLSECGRPQCSGAPPCTPRFPPMARTAPVSFKAEYIWIDGTEPTAKLRSKTKILEDGAQPGTWGFDGSSTGQAEGHASDRVLIPVFSCPDPIRGGDNILVLCEVENTDGTPHA